MFTEEGKHIKFLIAVPETAKAGTEGNEVSTR